MSAQFGRWNFEGPAPAPDYIDKVNVTLAPYGPDSNESYSEGGIKILYRAFHTTKESHRETQPHVSSSGVVITWDGRLDNRADLISELPDSVTVNSTDVAIVAAAYDKWGANCLGKLIGDWATSIWNPREHSVLLAKDLIGTKPLYYSFEKDHITWCTILDPLVLFAGRTFEICEEYIAGWFAIMFPAAHLTPYVGIHAVPPSSCVLLRPGKHMIRKHWDFDPGKRIRHHSNSEYEEHFRSVFAKSVQRRLRSDRPVLAELSGGMDSCCVVCVADSAIACGAAETPRLDTVSWYNDSGLSEEPFYFKKVEEKRGRAGHHIDISTKALRDENEVDSGTSVFCDLQRTRLATTPDSRRNLWPPEQYTAFLRSQEYRVILSGIGGEESTGGFVSSPTHELQDLLARQRFKILAHQLKAWAAKMRKRPLPLLWHAARDFLKPSPIDVSNYTSPAPWLHSGFVDRNRAALLGYPCRVKLLGPLPSFQAHILGLSRLQRALAAYVGGPHLHSELVREVRYPYLDRDFLEFMYSIPQEQIVGVGKRRFLTKRALVGIVPNEVLSRRQTFVVTADWQKDISTPLSGLAGVGTRLISSSVGIIDSNRFVEALRRAHRNEDIDVGNTKRALVLESWLRQLSAREILSDSQSPYPHVSGLKELEIRALSPQDQLASSWKANTTTERR